jgi:hypothetical protein
MSGGRRDRKNAAGRASVPGYRKGGEDPEIEFKPPLKPHKRLFIGLFIVLAAWVILLLVLYFRTVYPLRHA